MNWSDIFHYSDGVLRWRENKRESKQVRLQGMLTNQDT